MSDEQIVELQQKVMTLVGEQCKSFILVMEFETEEDNVSQTKMTWDGGFNTVRGLLCRASVKMDEISRDVD